MLLQLALAGLLVVILKLANTDANNSNADVNNNNNNVIFIVVDDLRADLPAYGNPHVLSPNIDRLSRRSFVFDRAFNQVPVCFPSRHSLLTGMRPDTLNIHTWTDRQHPYVDSLFSILVRAGFHSAAVGKLFHHPHNGSSEFTHGRWDGDWYKYQNIEDVFLNSTVTPDAIRADSEFRDHMIASQAIEKLNILQNAREKTGKPYILSVGFKLPHTQYHFPARFYHLYDDSPYLHSLLQLKDSQNRFPTESSPSMNYRCCAKDSFSPMVDFGATYSGSRYVYHRKGRFKNSHYKELLQGYWAGISFMDSQLGRLLREMDRLDVWRNTMVVFTADHGMLVGERGMWEKYTLFEETAKVPLMISIPATSTSSSFSSSSSSSSSSSPHLISEVPGSAIDNHLEAKHFPYPVELVDVVPTVLDILNVQRIPVKCPNSKLCFDFEGKSLWSAIKATAKLYNPAVSLGLGFSLPSSIYFDQPSTSSSSSSSSSNTFDLSQLKFDKYPGFRPFNDYFAITQMRRCPDNKDVKGASGEEARYDYKKEFLYWSPICNLKNRQSRSIMGYSVRTLDYRYNAWFRYTETKTVMKPDLSRPVYAEELYSHIGHRYNLTGDLHSEIDNLIADSTGIEQVNSPASFLHSFGKDHDLNLKDIQSDVERLNTADIKLVVKLHRYILLSFLANKATFNFEDSMQRMRARWSPYFTLNDKGRVTSVINSTMPSNLY